MTAPDPAARSDAGGPTLGEEARLRADVRLAVKAAVRYLDFTRHDEDLDFMDDSERLAVERAAQRLGIWSSSGRAPAGEEEQR